jgi:uncharacterized protein (TIGR02145 family)
MTMNKMFSISAEVFLILSIIIISSCKKNNDMEISVTDIDGNVYHIVTIGTQEWMKENLKTTKYNDGTAIREITDNYEWAALRTPAYCWYNNDAAAYKSTYGALYNWYVVSSESNGGKNVCPSGWHVPTLGEWETLKTYLGGIDVAGAKLKETGTTHWATPNIGATNETGFTALPGGCRLYYGYYFDVGSYGSWWTSTDYSSPIEDDAYFQGMNYSDTFVHKGLTHHKEYGFSVRCLKNN